VALVTRYYKQTPNMSDLKWCIIMVGTVVTTEAWRRIPADVQRNVSTTLRQKAA